MKPKYYQIRTRNRIKFELAMGLKWIRNGNQNGREMDPELKPKWPRNGPGIGAKMDPG